MHIRNNACRRKYKAISYNHVCQTKCCMRSQTKHPCMESVDTKKIDVASCRLGAKTPEHRLPVATNPLIPCVLQR